MARYSAVRRTDTLGIPVASLSFTSDGRTADLDGAAADLDGAAAVIADASYYLGGPRGGASTADRWPG